MYSFELNKHPQVLMREGPSENGGNRGILSKQPSKEIKTYEQIEKELKTSKELGKGKFPEGSDNTIIEFQKINGTPQAYKKQLMDYCIAHPKISEHGDFLKKKMAEIKQIGIDKVPQYHAIVETLMNVVKSKEFDNNTGFFTDIRLKLTGKIDREKDYINTLNSSLDEAIRTGKSVTVNFNEKNWNKISPEAEKYIKENPPSKIENDFIIFLKKGNLSKPGVLAYISREQGKIKAQNILPFHSEPYDKLFVKLIALASNEVLYSGNTSLSQYWNNTTIDKYLKIVEENKGKDGAIGYSNPNYQFFTIEQLKHDIMITSEKSDNKTGVNVTAWQSYLHAMGGEYQKLENIFGKQALEAISIYIHNKNGESRLTAGNPKFKTYIEEYYKKSEIANLVKETGKITSDQFIELGKILGNRNMEIPTNITGQINPFELLRPYITANSTPENILQMKNALEIDLKNIAIKAKEVKAKEVEKLNKFKTFTDIFTYLKVPIAKDIRINSDSLISSNLGKSESIKLLKLLNNKEGELNLYTQNIKNPLNNSDISTQLTIIKRTQTILNKQIEADNANIAFTASTPLTVKQLTQIIKKPQDQTNILNISRLSIESNNQNENIKQIKENLPKECYIKYDLPTDLTSLKDPKKWNILITAITKLENVGDHRNTEENQLLRILYNIKNWHETKSQVILDIEKSLQDDPSGVDIYKTVTEKNEILNSLKKSDLDIYRHISEFRDSENPNGNITESISQIPIGESISFESLLRDNSISKNIAPNIAIHQCSIEKTSITECTIYFAEGSGIAPVKSVPIKGITSFMEQANTYAAINCPSIIEQIPYINECISKATGKGTNSFDGIFDPYEAKRNLITISGLLGIKYGIDQSFDMFTKGIQQKFPTSSSITSKLIEQGILRPEGGCNKIALSKTITKIQYPG